MCLFTVYRSAEYCGEVLTVVSLHLVVVCRMLNGMWGILSGQLPGHINWSAAGAYCVVSCWSILSGQLLGHIERPAAGAY